MTKNRVVVFDEIGNAVVHTTDDPSSIVAREGCRVFVNPDLSYVNDIPPQLWNIEGERIVPLFGEENIRKRLANIGLKDDINRYDAKVQQDLKKLVDIPDSIENAKWCLIDQAAANRKEILDSISEAVADSRYTAMSHREYTVRTMWEIEAIYNRMLLKQKKWAIIDLVLSYASVALLGWIVYSFFIR